MMTREPGEFVLAFSVLCYGIFRNNSTGDSQEVGVAGVRSPVRLNA